MSSLQSFCGRPKSDRGRPWDRVSFDGFLDEVYWLRCGLAPAFGIAFGVVPLEGAAAIAAFAAISTSVVFAFVQARYVIDVASYGGMPALLQEGGMPSFALFMLIWIITYTAMHAADEDEYIYID